MRRRLCAVDLAIANRRRPKRNADKGKSGDGARTIAGADADNRADCPALVNDCYRVQCATTVVGRDTTFAGAVDLDLKPNVPTNRSAASTRSCAHKKQPFRKRG